jgi:hypothetical protein
MTPDDGTRRASAILARAQRRDVRPNIWASLRSDSGLPAWTLRRYAATAASLTAPTSGAAWSFCPLAGMAGAPTVELKHSEHLHLFRSYPQHGITGRRVNFGCIPVLPDHAGGDA